MNIIWPEVMDSLNQQRIASTLGCRNSSKLPEFLDNIFSHVEEYLQVQNNGVKPTITFLPLIKRIVVWDNKRQTISESHIGGECDRYRKIIRIAISDYIGQAIIHEFVHWLKPNLKEIDVKFTVATLIKYYRWQFSSVA